MAVSQLLAACHNMGDSADPAPHCTLSIFLFVAYTWYQVPSVVSAAVVTILVQRSAQGAGGPSRQHTMRLRRGYLYEQQIPTAFKVLLSPLFPIPSNLSLPYLCSSLLFLTHLIRGHNSGCSPPLLTSRYTPIKSYTGTWYLVYLPGTWYSIYILYVPDCTSDEV